RRPHDGQVNALIRDLTEASDEFRELRERHDVAVMRNCTKTILHPEVGPLTLASEVLPGRRQCPRVLGGRGGHADDVR
ncbi:MAG: hypothetical protein ABSB59_28995, partial [Streptosporangiaceae bacterium]